MKVIECEEEKLNVTILLLSPKLLLNMPQVASPEHLQSIRFRVPLRNSYLENMYANLMTELWNFAPMRREFLS